MTARELAGELEVSERTIYRDINALSYSGVPVYAERGPGGGISLIESYRSDLTGLNKAEARALFMLAIPAALTDLGVDQELRTAMRKLAAALPATFQSDEQRVRQRIHLDPQPWNKETKNPATQFLGIIQQAVWESFEIEVSYRSLFRPDMGALSSIIQPYGLVAKTDDWYIIGKRQDHIVVLEVKRFEDVHFTGDRFQFPETFNLLQFWAAWCREFEANRPRYPVRIRISPALYGQLPASLRKRMQKPLEMAIEMDDNGWGIVEIDFEYHSQALQYLLQFGGAIVVIEPIALRYSMQDYAKQIASVYDP